MARKKKEEFENKEEVTQEPTEQSTVRLVSLTMGATVPVMSYGNITASYTVTAESIDDAEAVLFKRIEKLFDTYSEKSRKAKAEAKVLPVIELPQDEPTEITTPIERSKHVIIAEAYLHNAKTSEAKDAVRARIKESKNFTDEEREALLKL